MLATDTYWYLLSQDDGANASGYYKIINGIQSGPFTTSGGVTPAYPLEYSGGLLTIRDFKNPVFTYSGSDLTRIDYADGSHKDFTYSSGLVSRIDHVQTDRTIRQDFAYSGSTLTSITETSF